MKTTVLAATTFIGAAVIGGVGYKLAVGCPQFADAVCIKASQKALNGEHFTATVSPIAVSPKEIRLKVGSNFMCPVAVRLHLEAKQQIEGIEDGVRPAYTTPALALLENGEGIATLTPELYPEFKVLPQGAYVVSIEYSDARTSPLKSAYYNEKLGLKDGLKIEGTATVTLPEGFLTQEQYAVYMENWQKAYTLAKAEGVNRKNISKFEKYLGKAQKEVQGAMIRYTFPNTLHAIFVNAETGAFLRAFRYGHGWEGL